MITFSVSTDVARATVRKPKLDRSDALRAMLGARVEALSPPSGRALVIANDVNALAQAAYTAFFEHYPLVLSPDAIWLCLAQGFARHVNANAEALRDRFVAHEGKAKLVVDRPDMELGRPGPWHEVIAAFSEQLGMHLGKKRDLVVADFSTTGPVERAASEVVLMDAFQGYFEYEMRAGCGIPEITLLGTPDDWRSIRTRAAVFGEYGLEHWTAALLPVLDQLVATAEGKVDTAFWRSFFRFESYSGGGTLTGWILTLFPYLDDRTPPDRDAFFQQIRAHAAGKGPEPIAPRTPVANKFLADWAPRTDPKHRFDGAALSQMPSGLASAPVKYTDVRTNQTTNLRFVGGLFGVTQDAATLALAPEAGWAITYA